MVFKITDMDKMHRNFIVTDESGNNMKVKGVQIAAVLASGNICLNARLIRDGFCVDTGNGILEIKPQMNEDLRKCILSIVTRREAAEKAEREANVKAQISAAKSESISTVEAAKKRKAEAIKTLNIPQTNKLGYVDNNNVDRFRRKSSEPMTRTETIYHQGTLYSSPEALCKAFGCKDVEKFKELYAAGYDKDICLGLRAIDPSMPKPQPRYKQMDRLLRGVAAEQ